MPHLSHPHSDLIARVRRIGGQVSAIERALEAGAECEKVLHLSAAVRGAVNGLMEEIIAEHLEEHVAAPGLTDADRTRGAQDLLTVIRRYSK